MTGMGVLALVMCFGAVAITLYAWGYHDGFKDRTLLNEYLKGKHHP